MRSSIFERALVAMLVAGCLPDAPERPSFVDGERVLAIVADPPEVAPGDVTDVRVLVAGPSGTDPSPQAYYALCLTPKPPAENDAVAPECWNQDYQPVGGPADHLAVTIPVDACARFGPDTPAGGALRPRDADETGGYYQPVRVAIPELAAFGFVRIRCALPDAPVDVSLAYRDAYRPNDNPVLDALTLRVNGADVDPTAIPLGARVELRLDWAPSSAETYLRYDAERADLVTEREALRVSWFVTGGDLSADVTGRTADEPEAFTTVMWRAPSVAGHTVLWAVARDSRGGAAFVERAVDVR